MNDKRALFERYPHLLHEQADPETVALVEQLDTVYRAPEPPAHLTLGAVLAQLEDEGKPARSPVALWSFRPVFWLPRRASTVLVAVALAVVLMAGSVYAFTSFLRPGLEPPPFDPGVSQVFKQHLLEEVHAAPQTIDGFTMNVQAAYADANQVVIGYTMTKPSGQSYDDPLPSDALLTTQQGEALHWAINVPLSGDAYTMTFTPLTWISSTAQQISLHLSIHELEVELRRSAPHLARVYVLYLLSAISSRTHRQPEPLCYGQWGDAYADARGRQPKRHPVLRARDRWSDRPLSDPHRGREADQIGPNH